MRIDILPEARDDLLAAFRFYERQARGLGGYFRESVLKDIDSLARAVFTPGFSDITAVEQAFPFRDLLSRRGERRPRPRDFGLPPRSFLVQRRIRGA